MNGVLQDLRYGLRLLPKAPGFTLVAVLALGLGIGANSMMFSALKGAVLRPFPFPAASRIVMLYTTRPALGTRQFGPSAGDFVDFQRQSRGFEQLAAFHGWSVNLTGQGDAELLEGYQVTPSFFPLLRMPAAMGRTLIGSDAEPGRVRSVVISYQFWKQRFAGDAHVIGKSIVLDGQEVSIAGVMPENFDFPMGAQVWAPFSWTPAEQADRQNHYLTAIGRLQPGVTRAQARAELDTIAARLEQQFPNDDAGQRVDVTGMVEEYTNGDRQFISVLMGAAVFVLLLACANVANLQLARATVRAREMAVRSALGASRSRILRQLLAENVVLALAGGIAGVLVGAWGIDLSMRRVPPFILAHVAGLRNIRLDSSVVIFTAATALLTGIVSGIVPGLSASHADVNEALKEGARGSEGHRSHRSRALLVSTEVALALVLLVGAGLMVQAFRSLTLADMGFDTHNILTSKLRLPKSRYATPAQRWNFYRDALQRIRSAPGVQADSAMTMLPAGWSFTRTAVRAEGAEPVHANQLLLAISNVVTPGYLDTMKMRLVAGRNFSDSDGPEAPAVVMINSNLAQQLWPRQDPIGRRVRLGRDETQPWQTVIGVVADTRISPFDVPPAMVLGTLAQQPVGDAAFALRTASDPLLIVPTIRQQLKQIDSSIPLYDTRTQEQVIFDNLSGVHTSADLMSAFGVVALILAAAGIFAVMAYSVRQRTREIGLRMALGAQRADVLRLVMASGLRTAGAGLVVGFVVSVALTKLLTSFLLNLIQLNLLALLGFTLLMTLVAALAALLPARWASRVDPMVALRCE